MITDGSLLEFPCEFPLKVMGKDSEAFYEATRRIVERHVGPLADDHVTHRPSRGGRYVATTFVIRAQSQAQLDAIYQDLSGSEHVVMCL